jgi:transcriptional regulator with XRE-family HTH domain
MAKSLREQFGRDVREARLRAGLSQTEVGKTTGKGQTYVSEIELGLANLTLHSPRLAAFFAIDIPRLLESMPKSTSTRSGH